METTGPNTSVRVMRASSWTPQNGGFDPVAGRVVPVAAAEHLGIIGAGFRQVGHHPVVVGAGDHGAESILVLNLRMGELSARERFRQGASDLVGHGGVGDDAAGGTALLSRVPQSRLADGCHGLSHVRVVADDDRHLASQLKVDPLEGFGRSTRNGRPRPHAACQRDHVDAWVGADGLTHHGAISQDHVQHALRQNFCGEIGEANGRERCDLAKLQHCGVPRHKGRGDLPDRHEKGVVPRRDQPDDAQRLTQDE